MTPEELELRLRIARLELAIERLAAVVGSLELDVDEHYIDLRPASDEIPDILRGKQDEYLP